MDKFLDRLNLRSKELEKAILYAEDIIQNAPEGTLRITRNKNTEQYYIRDIPNHTYGTYIKKSNTELIHDLAQKEYAQKLLKRAKQEKECIKGFLNAYISSDIEKLYEELDSRKRKIVTPYILPDEMYASQWQNTIYEGKKVNSEQEGEIITERGEKVRSKSEKIIADKLSLMNIPYHYEKPLCLKGYGVVYPDFTTLNKKTRKEYYWEHFGLMDKADYCEKAIKKIELMQRNGIYMGEGLIVTFETLTHPINIRIVENIIRKYLQ